LPNPRERLAWAMPSLAFGENRHQPCRARAFRVQGGKLADLEGEKSGGRRRKSCVIVRVFERRQVWYTCGAVAIPKSIVRD